MDKPEVFGKLHSIPIILFVALPATVIITYVTAVAYDHVEPGFPYISDAATNPPESCIFAQFLNMIAALMCFVVYIRYSQIRECTIAFRLNTALQKWNTVSLVLGILATIGLSLVANFQETSVIVVHFIGAFSLFGFGTIYLWTQALCSYRLHPFGCSRKVAHMRLCMSIFNTICFFVILICGLMARAAYRGTNPRKWTKKDGGWELHVTSTAAEWICGLIFCIYILTFSAEFKEMEMRYPKVCYKSEKIRSSNEVLNESQDSAGSQQGGKTIT